MRGGRGARERRGHSPFVACHPWPAGRAAAHEDWLPMTLAVRAVFWVIAYLGAVLSPLVFAVIGASQPDHGFWTDFSVALGFVGFAMMGLEFALVARFRLLAAPFGQDALLQFHRQIGYAGLAFLLVHFAISARWSELTPAKALAAPLLVWFGMTALLALIVLIVS